VISIVAIVSGGSAGPEGPVLYIGAGISVLSRLVRGTMAAAASSGAGSAPPTPLPAARHSAGEDGAQESDEEEVSWPLRFLLGAEERSYGDDALIGGSAAIAAFFDHPISGCMFVMELPHMHGSLNRGATLPAALIASVFAWLTHRVIMDEWNIMAPPTFPAACSQPKELWLALPCGLFAAFLSFSFVKIRGALDNLPYPAAVRGLVMGALVGFVGLYKPDTLTWGEFQIDIIANDRQALAWDESTARRRQVLHRPPHHRLRLRRRDRLPSDHDWVPLRSAPRAGHRSE